MRVCHPLAVSVPSLSVPAPRASLLRQRVRRLEQTARRLSGGGGATRPVVLDGPRLDAVRTPTRADVAQAEARAALAVPLNRAATWSPR